MVAIRLTGALALVLLLASSPAARGEPWLPGPPIDPPARAAPALAAWRVRVPDRETAAARQSFDLLELGTDGRVAGGLVRWPARRTSLDASRPSLFEPPAWSPDGRRVAFTVELGRRGTDLWVADVESARIRPLTRDGRSHSPVWSPDGSFIAFARVVDRRSAERAASWAVVTAGLWRVSPTGEDARPLAPAVPASSDEPAAFTAAGSRLLVVRRSAIGEPRCGRERSGILAFAASGSPPVLLRSDAEGAAPSPSGDQLLYATDRDRNGALALLPVGLPGCPGGGLPQTYATELYFDEPGGRATRRLTRTNDRERAPAWSPGGGLIAFATGPPAGRTEDFGIAFTDPRARCRLAFLAGRDLGGRGTELYGPPAWRPSRGPEPSACRAR